MNKHTQEPTQRQLRLAEQIRHILAKVLVRGDIRDPSLAGKIITVTEVRLSPDLQRATVFVCRLGRSDVDELLPALKRAAPYMRRRVAHAPDAVQTRRGYPRFCLAGVRSVEVG